MQKETTFLEVAKATFRHYFLAPQIRKRLTIAFVLRLWTLKKKKDTEQFELFAISNFKTFFLL